LSRPAIKQVEVQWLPAHVYLCVLFSGKFTAGSFVELDVVRNAYTVIRLALAQLLVEAYKIQLGEHGGAKGCNAGGKASACPKKADFGLDARPNGASCLKCPGFSLIQ